MEEGDNRRTHHMTTISTHSFGQSGGSSEGNNVDAFTIHIIENMQEDYGMFVWPCSIVLAEYVWQQKLQFLGMTVVELGAGTCLPGLVAAKVGADVILTDSSNKFEADVLVAWKDCSDMEGHKVLKTMRKICDLNNLNCKILGLTWGEWDAPLFSLNPKIILGADVLYDANDFDDLFATVTFLLRNCPRSVFITTYHNRSGHHLIEHLMVKWGLNCTKLIDAFSFMPPWKASTLRGNIQLVEITLLYEQS